MHARLTCLVLSFCIALSVNAQYSSETMSKLIQAEQRAYDKNSDSLNFCYNAAVQEAVKIGDINAEIEAHRIYGIKKFLSGQPDSASTILINAARKAEKFPPSRELAVLYYAIAQVYSKNNYLENAEDYLRRGIAVALAVKSNSAMGDGYNRIGIQYERKNQPDSALFFYEQALRVNERDSSLRLGAAYSMENIASIHATNKDYATALQYLKRSLAIKLEVGQPIDLSMIYINIGETFGMMKQFDSAIRYARKTLEITEAIKYTELESYTYQFLSGIYEARKDPSTALIYYKRYSALNDSLLNVEKTRQLAENDARFKTEKREQRIMQLSQQATIQNLQIKQRSTLLYFISGLFIVSAFAGYLFYNRRKLKAEAKLQAEISRQQAITTREVLNAEEKERKRIAADLHDGVGQMLSASLMNLNGFFGKQGVDKHNDPDAARIMNLVTESYDELRAISHRMMPKALTSSGLVSAVRELLDGIDPEKISVSFECVGLDRLNEETETVLYRVIQESINNAIKHADASALNVQILKDEDGISVTIEDDGKGFDKNNVRKGGIGLKNIYSRVQLQNGTVDIDSQPGMGTVVAIHLPA